jgi:adenosylhomocysteine nucleosidase
VRRLARDRPGLRVVVTGMGPAAAGRAAGEVVSRGTRAVVVAGLAGGCAPGLAPGTVVVATRLCDLAGGPVEAPPSPAAVREAAAAAAPPAVAGTVATGDGVVDGAADRARLAAAGVLAVETEAAGWAPACRRAGVPLVVVRAVLDTADRPLGAAAGLVASGASAPSPWRLARLALRPRAWPVMARLARAAAPAERRAAAAAVAAATALSDGAR